MALNVNPSWIVGKSDMMNIPSQSMPKIVKYYEMLNDTGKHEATKRVMELTEIPRYIKEEASDYLSVKAAHNDSDITAEELKKMEDDIANLKRPD